MHSPPALLHTPPLPHSSSIKAHLPDPYLPASTPLFPIESHSPTIPCCYPMLGIARDMKDNYLVVILPKPHPTPLPLLSNPITTPPPLHTHPPTPTPLFPHPNCPPTQQTLIVTCILQ